MKKVAILLLAIIILVFFVGCNTSSEEDIERLHKEVDELKKELEKTKVVSLPVYSIDCSFNEYNIDVWDDIGHKYITVSGDYKEEGLIAICHKEYNKAGEKECFLFFEPNAPRIDDETSYEDGRLDTEYCIKMYLLYTKSGEVKVKVYK